MILEYVFELNNFTYIISSYQEISDIQYEDHKIFTFF
jgi:hypothetical protein